MNTRPFLISRLKEEWNNLDPVDPLRGLIADAIDALAEQPAQQQEPVDSAEKAGAFMEARLWEFIDMAAVWLEAKPDPRTWAHVMIYAPPANANAGKPWVGLSTVELDEIDAPIRERGHATIAEIYRAIEAKLREKNT